VRLLPLRLRSGLKAFFARNDISDAHVFFLKNHHSMPGVFHYLPELEARSSEAASGGSSAMVCEADSSIIDISVVYSG
jgi:hypothetical protein